MVDFIWLHDVGGRCTINELRERILGLWLSNSVNLPTLSPQAVPEYAKLVRDYIPEQRTLRRWLHAIWMARHIGYL